MWLLLRCRFLSVYAYLSHRSILIWPYLLCYLLFVWFCKCIASLFRGSPVFHQHRWFFSSFIIFIAFYPFIWLWCLAMLLLLYWYSFCAPAKQNFYSHHNFQQKCPPRKGSVCVCVWVCKRARHTELNDETRCFSVIVFKFFLSTFLFY